MVIDNSIELLRQTAPNWFTLTKDSPEVIDGFAAVPVVNGVGRTAANLRITTKAAEVIVSETMIGTVFPARCPERHVQGDGSFCIGYRAGFAIYNFDDAVVWWGLLEQFLRLQRVAARTRRWPARQAIAHGEAGPHHIRALEAAKELDLEEDYFEMLEGEPKWFSGRFPRLSKDSRRLLNGRLPCPLACTSKRRWILRTDCRRKDLVARLLSEERLRQKKELAFWKDCRLLSATCCGTMDGCPLSLAGTS